MSGLWHDCACGCEQSHRIVDRQVQCDHPNLADLIDSDGRPFPINPAGMCRPCLVDLGGTVFEPLRSMLALHQADIVAEWSEGIESLRRGIEAEAGQREIEPGDDAS